MKMTKKEAKAFEEAGLMLYALAKGECDDLDWHMRKIVFTHAVKPLIDIIESHKESEA